MWEAPLPKTRFASLMFALCRQVLKRPQALMAGAVTMD
jgi:hypothetical protein